MWTGYGPYDLHQIELVKQDKERQVNAFCGPVAVEGLSVSAKREVDVVDTHPLRRGIPHWLRALGAALTRPAFRWPLTGRPGPL